MDAVKIFSENWLEIIVGAYLLGMVLYGHYKGFIRLAVSALALIVTLIAVRVAMPYATDWLKEKTPVYDMIQSGMEKAVGLEGLLGAGTEDPEADPESIGPGWENSQGPGGLGVARPADERKIIEGLKLPEQLKRTLIENNNGEVYQTLGVELFRDYIGSYLTGIIVQILAFLLLFLIIFILLHILVAWLDLMARLPILSGMNKIAGAILGGLEGLFFVWIGSLVFTALSGTGVGIAVLEQIESSHWLSYLYNHNFLVTLIMGVLHLVI